MVKLNLPSLVLAAALEFSAIGKIPILGVTGAITPAGVIYRVTALAATLLGTYDAVSGATVLPPEITSPLQEIAETGQAIALPLSTAPYPSPYWTAEGLPDGLQIQGIAGDNDWSIIGIPTTAGFFLVKITAYNPQFNGPVSGTLLLTIEVARGPPLIELQPIDQEVAVGQQATFVVVASSSTSLQYQWRKDGMILPSRNTSTLTLSSVAAGDAGLYTVDVQNEFGLVTSHAARLGVSLTKDLKIDLVQSYGKATVLRWQNPAGACYNLLASETAVGPWTTIALADGNGQKGMIISVTLPQIPDKASQFYRLRRSADPEPTVIGIDP